jgi:hypothetical protein
MNYKLNHPNKIF